MFDYWTNDDVLEVRRKAKEAYKYFDKVMAISKKLNMPSFNFDVHNKIAEAESRIIRYRKLHNYAYSQNEIDEYNKKTADIVYKEFKKKILK